MGKRTATLTSAILFVLAGAAATAALQAATNLVAHYELDSPAPTDEIAPSNLDGTLTGAPPSSTDVPAPIASFSSHSLDVGPGSAAEQFLQTGVGALGTLQTASYTVMAWFKPNSVNLPIPDNQQGIVMKAGNHEGIYWTGGGVFAMEHWINTNDGMAAQVRNSAAGTWASTFATGAWYHVAGVVDTTAGHTRVYVHPATGAAATVATTTWASTAWGAETIVSHGVGYQAGAPWRVGIALPGSADPTTGIRWQADGLIDDVRFYSRALTQAEIQAVAAGTDLGAVTPPAPPPAPGPAPAPAPPPAPHTTDHEEGLLGEKCECGTVHGLPVRFAPWLAAAAGAFAALGLAIRRRS